MNLNLLSQRRYQRRSEGSEGEGGVRAACPDSSLRGAPRCPGKKGFAMEPDAPPPPECLRGGLGMGILHLPQLFAGNLWLDVSVSVEPEPKSLWFPGVTTALYLPKAEESVLALSARPTSGLH